MGENTSIEWADDSVNVWWGCTRHGEGCRNCYAETLAKRFGLGWGPQAPRIYMPKWEATLRRLNDKARKAGKPRLVFINSMSDFFEDFDGPIRYRTEDEGERILGHVHYGPKMINGVVGTGVVTAGQMLCDPFKRSALLPGYRSATLADLRADAFRVFDECKFLRLLLLTKRPENVRRMIPIKYGRRDAIVDGKTNVAAWRRENVWLGTSVACQEDADRNVPELLKCRDLCAKLFLSIEPLVGPVNLARLDNGGGERYDALRGEVRTVGGNKFRASDADPIDWVIVGGESGPHARPCNIEWIRRPVRQCAEAGVLCFVKQAGARVYDNDPLSRCSWPGLTRFRHRLGDADDECEVELRDPKGGDPAEWPEDLRVREVPTGGVLQ